MNRETNSGKIQWIPFFLPIASSSLSMLACVVSYAVGIETGQIQPFPFLPYISDTGTKKPQSSIFTLLMVLSCFFLLPLIVLRYYQIQNSHYYIDSNKFNKSSLAFGCLLILGKVIVASFQLTSNRYIHYIGAILYFLSTVLFAGCQVYITYKSLPVGDRTTKIIFYVRLTLSVIMVISILVLVIFFIPPLTVHNKGGANVAQSAEWTLAI